MYHNRYNLNSTHKGSEFAYHEEISVKFKADFYFAHP